MKQLLNTLYITTQGSYVSKKGDTVLVSVEKETKLRVPIHTLGSVVCFGQVSCSPFMMGLCGERNVTLSFLTEYGKFLARVHGPVNGNVLLRRQHFRMADDVQICTSVARSIVFSKIANSRIVLQRALRDHSGDHNRQQLQHAADYLSDSLTKLQKPVGLDTLRGIEGESANAYFGVFDHLINDSRGAFTFTGRNRRPPLDNVNAMLSFIYTLLAHDLSSALEAVGLDPAVGFYHADRPGRNGLALDIMEEFRAYLADRLVLSLINRQQVRPQGFKKTESGAVLMDDETRKTVLVAWQKRKQEEITHPFIGEKIKLGLLPHVQAMLLARYIRGDIEAYPPFFWR